MEMTHHDCTGPFPSLSQNLTFATRMVFVLSIQGQQQDQEEPLGLSDLFSKIIQVNILQYLIDSYSYVPQLQQKNSILQKKNRF